MYYYTFYTLLKWRLTGQYCTDAEKAISNTTFEGNLMMTIEVWQTILVTEMVMYQILNRCIRKTTQLYVACICAIFPHFCSDVITT